jgi:hypothetical protein
MGTLDAIERILDAYDRKLPLSELGPVEPMEIHEYYRRYNAARNTAKAEVNEEARADRVSGRVEAQANSTG